MSKKVAQVRSNSRVSLYFLKNIKNTFICVNLIRDVSFIFQNASKSSRLRFNFELSLSILHKG